MQAVCDSPAGRPYSPWDFNMQDFQAARLNMVESQLRVNAVIDLRLLEAFASTPRELFVPEARRSLAYMDECLLIADATGARKSPRFLMEPRVFGKMLQLAKVKPDDAVLDIGCGLGYSAAVLGKLAARVIALECDEALAARASATLSQLLLANVSVETAQDLSQGCVAHAPYDLIVINGAVQRVPEMLLDQLAEGGRLVAIVGSRAKLFIRSDGRASARDAFDANVHVLPGFQLEESFVF